MQNEARVSPAVPGVQQRFRGWREATPSQRLSALSNENAMLLAVVAERDAALLAGESERRKLKEQHAILLAKWRDARRGGGQRQPPLNDSPPSAAPTSMAASESPG